MEQIDDSDFVLDHSRGAEPVDEATKASIRKALAQVERGETLSTEESRKNRRERAEAWRKGRRENLAA